MGQLYYDQTRNCTPLYNGRQLRLARKVRLSFGHISLISLIRQRHISLNRQVQGTCTSIILVLVQLYCTSTIPVQWL